MSAIRLTATAHDRMRWSTLAAALANVPTAAWTTAIVLKRASIVGTANYYAHSYLLSGSGAGASQLGTTFIPGSTNANAAVFTVGSNSIATVKNFNSTSNVYALVISKATGSATPRLGWMDLTAGGAMTYENHNLAQGNRSAATMLEIGGWQNTSDWFDGWVGILAWWNVGLMSDANMAALFANKKTSDIWGSAAGNPVFLAELNNTPSSVIDLAGNATGSILLGTSGPSLDTGETLAGWTFDGKGFTGHLDGRLDEIDLYSRVLNSDEALEDYTAGIGTSVFNAEQRSFRGRNDNGNETTATYKAGLNANWSQQRDVNCRVRFEIQETGSVSSASTYKLRYSKNGGAKADVNASSLNVRSSASPNLADGAATTDQLTAGTGAFVAGAVDEVDGATGSITLSALGHTEVEFCFQIRSADVAVGDTIELFVESSVDATVTYAQIPSIVVVAALAQIEQKSYRFRNDDGDEASATPKAAQNTTITQAMDEVVRLRLEMQETAGGSGVVTYQLQARKNGGAYADVSSASLNVRMANSTNVTDGTGLTNQLTAGTGTYTTGRFDDIDGIGLADPIVANGHTEVEFAFMVRSSDCVASDVIDLRVVPAGDVTGATTYTQTPSLTASAVAPPPPPPEEAPPPISPPGPITKHAKTGKLVAVKHADHAGTILGEA